ncbi:MAG TPA: AAA family ATPase, partial [Kineosporiaceae bacterium]|nr:AAA family ATPase [Kineosporiaceae bacterium]
MITTSETPGVVAQVPDRGWALRSLNGGSGRFAMPGSSVLLASRGDGSGDGDTPLFPNPATGLATRSAESDQRVKLSELGLSLTAGRGRLVLVTGERGSGRSRLAMSVLDGVRSGADVALIGLQGAPGYPATAALSLLRAVARTRPEGPAARLVAEAGEESQPSDELVEELALALVAEAVRRPVAVLLEDVHVADEELLVFVEHLLTVVDTVPLLLVVTAATGWGAAAPRAGRWRSWVGRYGTLHLPVPVPTRAELAEALSDTCRSRLSPQALDAVLENARGNPRIAQELALWTLEGSPADDVPGTCLVRELVGAHEQEDVLAAVAVADMPVDSRLVARVTSTSSTASREVLERARMAGLVRYHREAGCVDTYTMAHPMYAAASRSLIDHDRKRSLHLAISSVLIGEHAEAPDAAPQIARHLVASGHPRAETGDWCLRAARWYESVGRLTEAVELAQAGLDAVSDLDTRMELVAVLSGCYRRLGDARAAAGVLRAALRLVSGQPRLGVPLAAELLELRDCMTASAAQTLLAYAQQSCPPDRPDLLVRLAATEAAMTFDRDPAAGRRAAQRVVRTVDSVDDEAARAAALRVAARTLMGPAHLGDLQRIATTHLAEPGVDGLRAAAA